MDMMHRSLVGCFLVASALGACGDDNNPAGPTRPDAGPSPDAGPTEVPLDRAHAGGAPSTVALDGTRAFIGVGPRLAIWELSTTPPTLLGESAPLRGVVNAVAAVGDRVYVAERLDLDSRLHVFDVTTPAAPVETHAFSIAGRSGYSVIRDLEGAPGRLYVADQEQGVLELDLADPDAPTTLQVVPPTGVTGLTRIGSRLYYTSESFFGGASAGALDLDNALADLGGSPLGNLAGIAFADKDLVIGAGPDGIYVYDVSDPSNPIERFHHGEAELGPFARAVATSGSTAWVPAHDGLHTLDLTTPTAIAHTGPLAVATTGVTTASANGDVLAIATDRGRLLSFGIATAPTQPADPQVVDVTLCADCVGVAVADGTIYIADIVGGLRTGALADLAPHGRSAALPVVPMRGGLEFVYEGVAVAGTYAFVADWLFGLRVYDVTSSFAPVLVGSLATGGSPSGVTVDGDRVYVAEGTNGGMLRVIDVSNPAQPIALGGVETSKAMAVEVRGTTAYVADESLFGPGGLRIFDVANPAAITQLGLYNTDCLWARDVALIGNLAVVACGGDGFHWIDVSNPASPTRIAVTRAEHETSSAMSVATWDGHAVLGHDRGVIVMSAGPVPQTIASFSTSWPVRALAVPTPGRIVAACGPGGVYQWEL